MRIAVLGLWIALSACSVGPAPDDEVSCSRQARTGRYLVQYSVLSGTCGAIASEVSRFESGAIVPEDGDAGCTYGAPSFRNGDCSAVIRTRCTVGTGTSTADVDLTQIDDEGASLSGTAAVRVEDASGNVTCTGSYGVTASRQAG